MTKVDGTAIVYCEGAFNTTNGKTAHGLVRFTRRYCVAAVIDSRYAGSDAGEVLDGNVSGIPICRDFSDAIAHIGRHDLVPTHFVIGLAPDGGRLPDHGRQAVREALIQGLHVDAGLHDFLSEDAELARLARESGAEIRDVRKPPARGDLHFFSGAIERVTALKVAILGTDSAIGKRTTAWILKHALDQSGIPTEMIGTGQTAWMQGARYGIVLDTIVNDFVAGEIEHAVVRAWEEAAPEVMILEGQGSLMNPAYPGGFELLAAGRPDIVVLQHAPMRAEYDGFPGYPLHPLPEQIRAIELISGKPVVAITLNNEGIPADNLPVVADMIRRMTGLPAMDVLHQGPDELVKLIQTYRS